MTTLSEIVPSPEDQEKILDEREPQPEPKRESRLGILSDWLEFGIGIVKHLVPYEDELKTQEVVKIPAIKWNFFGRKFYVYITFRVRR